MKRTSLFVLSFLLGLGPQTPQLTPTLSASQQIAIQALEQQKAAARLQFNKADEQERDVMAEFARQHSGWHLDPMTFTPTKDEKPPAK